MIYFFVEVPFAPQLVTLKADKFSQGLLELKEASVQYASGFEQLSSQVWVITFSHQKTGTVHPAAEGIARCVTVLGSLKSLLLAYHGVMVTASDRASALRIFKSFRMEIPYQNCLWASEDARAILTPPLSFTESLPGWFLLQESRAVEPQPIRSRASCCTLEEAEDLRWFLRTKGPGFLRVASAMQGLQGFTAVLEDEQPGISSRCFYLHGSMYDKDEWEPLIRALRIWRDRNNLSESWLNIIAGFHDADTYLRPSLGREDIASMAAGVVNWIQSSSVNDRMILVVSGQEHMSGGLVELVREVAREVSYSKPLRIVSLEPHGVLTQYLQARDFFRTISINGENPQELGEEFSRLRAEEKKVVLLCGYARGLVPVKELAGAADHLGINRVLLPEMFRQLADRGLLAGEELLTLSPTLLEVWQRTCVGGGDPDFNEVRSILTRQVMTAYSQGRVTMQPAFWDLILNEFTDWKTVSSIGYSLVLGQSRLGIRGLGESIQQNMAQGKMMSVLQEGWLRLFQTEVFHLNEQAAAAENSLVTIERLPGIEDSAALLGFRKLLQARLFVYAGRWDSAITDTKSALISFQSIGNVLGEIMGMLLYGEICAAKNKLGEAKDYVLMAVREAEATGTGWIILLSSCFEALSWFFTGYYSRVFGIIQKDGGLSARLEEVGFFSWSLFIRFLQGRVCFSLGDYDQARKIFTQMPSWANGDRFRDWRREFQIWGARCDVYSSAIDQGLSVLLPWGAESGEARLFAAEGCILKADYSQAHQILNEPMGEIQLEVGSIPFILQPLSGFWEFEDRFIGTENGFTVESAMAQGLRALALAGLGHVEEAREILTSLTRNRPHMLGDPYYHWHLLWYQGVLEQSIRQNGEDGQDDFITVLGKAVKAMQERNSKIEDPAHRRLFLQSEYWNKKLIARGRHFNLL
ncbi:hypothetical protein [Spirochaeta lutea]|uniref:MalT-like TPR region domain-containing protein n=1 Tax=Spirochaeta lutea TaxID=1480694 RepID=A0A098QVE3_9SPIO|nr:hypothetical protein [Spirochaeta lutea]KGE71338.1 hypothetical protein DC28_11030 [Spirochaeta lutea]